MQDPQSHYKLPEPIESADDSALARENHFCSVLFGLSLVAAVVMGIALWA
ncbi:MAG: hypothetical protein AAGC73_09875 [Verrucomicrobiota bacterium]